MKPRIKNSVSVVKINNTNIEFFLSDIRKIKQLKVRDADIFISLIHEMDGTNTMSELAEKFRVNKDSLNEFLHYLKTNNLLITDNITKYDGYSSFRRIIYFLGNYANDKLLLKKWEKFRRSQVVIVGAGTVGTWVAINLVQSGVQNITIIDDDYVEISNLHRQLGYFIDQVGDSKVSSLKKRLLSMVPSANIKICQKKMCSATDLKVAVGKSNPDLIINSADYPTVDKTSTWISEYCMPRRIPHIIGGGYNLHLSLIGQTILPFKSACMKCIEKQLKLEEPANFASIKKMEVPNRKIGSLGPASNIIASFIGMEAIKILANITTPANINRRGEFDILNMGLSFKKFQRDKNCEWCGIEGKFTKYGSA